METNKIISNYDALIKSAMKAHNSEQLNTYRLIKAKLLEFITQKNAPELNKAAEIKILNKMSKEIQEDIDIRLKANRLEQIPEFKEQLKYISELLPKQASEKEIDDEVNNYIKENGEFTQKEMGNVIKYVKSKFTNVDGATVAKIVKSHLK